MYRSFTQRTEIYVVTNAVTTETLLTEVEQRAARTSQQKETDAKAAKALAFARKAWRDALVEIFPARRKFSSTPADLSSCNPRWLAITRLAQYVALKDLYDREYIINILKRAYWICKDEKIPVDDGPHDVGDIAVGSIINIAIVLLKMEAAQHEALPPSA